MMYYYGKGVSKDCKEAIKLYEFMKCIFYGILVMLLVSTILFLPSSNAMGQQCELLRDKHGIKVYKKHIEGSNIYEFKGVTVVNAKIETVVEVMLDFKAMTKWIVFIEEFRVLKGLDGNSIDMRVYISIDPPWPVSNRDCIMKITGEIRNNKVTADALASREQIVPLKKGYIRLTNLSIKWVIESITDDKTSVSYSVRVDPEGYIPAWIINSFIKNQPFYTLYNLKQMVKFPKYIKAENSSKLLTVE
jgi:hypothetical protein